MPEANVLKTKLIDYNNEHYHPGASWLKRAVWYVVNLLFFLNPLCIWSDCKVSLLRMFGAKAGKGIVIKPRVNIKYPWNLSIGNDVWIGEKVWIDSLDTVHIEDNVCISQAAILICGNHDYTKSTFDLILGEIILEEGSWIGAGTVVGPGTHAGSHAVAAAGSVVSGDLKPYTIYSGNPAVATKKRKIRE